MATIWSRMGKAALQKYIGVGLLERLECLLPALQPREFNTDKIYTHDSLTKIFESFTAHTLISSKEFRYMLFNALTPEQLSKVEGYVGGLKGESFEDKISGLVALGWKNNETTKAIISALDIPSELLPEEIELPPEEQLLEPPIYPFKTLKDYQTTICFKALEKLQTPRARFVLQMPTGSGKTRAAMEIVCQTLNDSPERSTITWLAHSDELCVQAYECFLEVWSHVGKLPIKLVRAWGEGAGVRCEFPERAMVIGGFQKLHAQLRTKKTTFNELAQRSCLVIIDEAHKVLAPTYNAVTRALAGDSAAVIGLTATPGRSVVDEEENKALADFFFNEVLTIESGAKTVIEYLRDREVLAKTEYSPLITDRDYELSDKEKQYLEKFFDLPKGVLSRIASDDIRNIEIVKSLQQECSGGRQVLFFGCSVDHSKFISALLGFLGIKAAHLDGDVPRQRRAGQIEAFRQGELQVLCNYGVLSTGFDAPKVDLVFISRPTASIVLYSQMIGRGLRGPAIGGTEKCKIIDVKDNIAGFSNEDEIFHYFDDYYVSGEC